MCSVEHASLAAELQQQLHSQIHALAEIEEAVAAGLADEELLAVKQQLEEAIPALRDSLQELVAEQHVQVEVPGGAAGSPPNWLRAGAICRFRYQNGQWYHGVVDSWQPQQQLPVQVHFRYPTRPFMLHPVQLPLGLVLQGSSSSSSSSHSRAEATHAGQQQQQQQQWRRRALCVGCRVLAQPPGQQLWQQAEVTAISEAAAAAAAAAAEAAADIAIAGADVAQQQQQGGHGCTVLLVESGQSLILPTSAVAVSSTAAVSAAELNPAAAAATGSAAAAAAAAAAAVGSWVDEGSDMSMNNEDEEAASSRDDGSSSISSGFMSGSERDDDACRGGSGSAGKDDESEDEEAGGQGFARIGLGVGGALEHARLAAEAGVQSETAKFAAWEHHGRGIASKLMAAMGFRRGGGLGKTGSGMNAPLEINILPPKKGLGTVSNKQQQRARGTSNKPQSKKGRGGERSRRRKAAAARHAAKAAAGDRQLKMEAATGSEGLFAFINYSLGAGSEAAEKLRESGVCGGSRQQMAGAAALASAVSAASCSSTSNGSRGALAGSGRQQQQRQQQPDRKGLVGSHDDMAEKKARVAQLTAMLQRNKTNKGLAPQIQAKLAAAQRDLDAAAAQHKQLHKAVASREAAEKWIKF